MGGAPRATWNEKLIPYLSLTSPLSPVDVDQAPFPLSIFGSIFCLVRFLTAKWVQNASENDSRRRAEAKNSKTRNQDISQRFLLFSTSSLSPQRIKHSPT